MKIGAQSLKGLPNGQIEPEKKENPITLFIE